LRFFIQQQRHQKIYFTFTLGYKGFNSDKPIILQIGTNENKNLIRLARALKDIRCTLDIVGELSADQTATLRDCGIEYSNSFNLTEKQIILKYNESDLLAFVSTYEGFGMPILEANAVGRPVVTSNVLSMPEVAGDAACLVNPYDISQIRAGIQRVIDVKIYRETLVDNGFRNVRRFDPSVIANQYLQLYREILSDQSH
jgi:glycosyltransferase involved in cell wall biosynthesis